MQLVKIVSGELTTISEIIADHTDPNLKLVFPDDLNGVDLSAFGVAVVEPSQPPSVASGEVAEMVEAEQYELGKWRAKWLVRPMTTAEVKALVPQSITRRQARIVLSRHGYLATVEAAIAAMPGQAGEEARIEWADASVFNRDHPLIAAMAAMLGLTEEQVDALYIEAGAI